MKAIVLAALALLTLPLAAQGATTTTLQPGDVVLFGEALCTLNFVYDGIGPLAGSVFLGTAAHSVTGQIGHPATDFDGDQFIVVAYTRDYDEGEVRCIIDKDLLETMRTVGSCFPRSQASGIARSGRCA